MQSKYTFVAGPTLKECWDSFSTVDKRPISGQLFGIMKTLRRLEQDHSDQLIGMAESQRLSCIQDHQVGSIC